MHPKIELPDPVNLFPNVENTTGGMKPYYRLFTVLLTIALTTRLPAQVNPKAAFVLHGLIFDTQHQPLPHATIRLLPGGGTTLSDSLGRFSLTLPKTGKITVEISCIGYRTLTETRTVDPSASPQTWQLKEDSHELAAARVTAQSGAARLKAQPIKAQIIQTAASKEQPSTLIQLMNRSPGIRIRQTGGLGSNSNLLLNGFQNRSIKYFKDGIPLDCLGAGFDISLVPVNMLDHVEVYKGVLPVYLGADALGGALNLVTRSSPKSFGEISYEIGSFNTHRISLNTLYKSRNEHGFAGVDGFFNYSDNSYGLDVTIPDSATGVGKGRHVKAFHNQFVNSYLEVFAGLSHLKWADELRLTATQFSIRKQFQYGSTMDIPFGAARGTQSSIVPSLLYKKSTLRQKLDITEFLVANTLNVKMVDTLHGHYDWLGQFTPNPSQHGELSNGGALSNTGFTYFTSRTNLSYKLSAGETISLNVVHTRYTRKGSDPLGNHFTSGVDVLSVPAKYNKTALTLGLSSDLIKDRLQNNLIGKYFHYATNASDGDYLGNEIHTQNSKADAGFADGLKYVLNKSSFLTLSAESALRLPEQDELFGDGHLKLSNFALQPERSTNINLGYTLSVPEKYSVEVNSFYRYTKNLILLMPINFIYAQSQNVDQVRGIGLDADGNYFIWPWLNVNGNFTYQSLRLVHTGYATTEGARLKNTPFFFANAGANARLDHLFTRRDRIHFYWFYSFVRQYYLDYIPKNVEPSGFLGLFGKAHIDAQNIIPDQSTHTIGFTYCPVSSLAFGAQLKNVFDTRIYDNFRIQNPGRSISLKISYSL